jgi:predicted RNase H-like nuclease (RuvC/YqgF family)
MNDVSLEELGLKPMRLTKEFQNNNTIISAVVETSESTGKLNTIAFVGTGLSQIWQLESSLEWQLFKNILKAFKINMSGVIYFDSQLWQSQRSTQGIIDEIIKTGVNNIYSFDEESSLIRELQENIDVVLLPKLAEQLKNWKSKKKCYMTLLANV